MNLGLKVLVIGWFRRFWSLGNVENWFHRGFGVAGVFRVSGVELNVWERGSGVFGLTVRMLAVMRVGRFRVCRVFLLEFQAVGLKEFCSGNRVAGRVLGPWA